MRDATLWWWALLGPLVGIVLGHVLSRRWQYKQWKLENRRREYRELLTALAAAYTIMQRYVVAPFSGEGDRIEVGDKTEMELRLEEAKMKSFRVLQDRIVIQQELKSGDIDGLWAEAFHNFEHHGDERKFADRYFLIRDRIVAMATDQRPYWQPRYIWWLRWIKYKVWRLRTRESKSMDQ